jgi:hypothetical protein
VLDNYKISYSVENPKTPCKEFRGRRSILLQPKWKRTATPFLRERDDHFTTHGVLCRSEKKAGVVKVVREGGQSRLQAKFFFVSARSHLPVKFFCL